ncbi:hypothetical protein EBU94_05725, partial [bacterium]|nr:hypothetical protein [bacterium]
LEKIVKRILKEQSNKEPILSPRPAPSDRLGPAGSMGAETNRKLEILKSVYDLNNCCPCVPKSVRFLVLYVKAYKKPLMEKLGVDEKTLLFLLKASLATMGRESSFATNSEFTDDATVFLNDWHVGGLADALVWLYNKAKGTNKKPSLGASQFTQETWDEYGLDKLVGDFYSSTSVVKSGLGTMFRLLADYRKGIQKGLKNEPSVNPIAVKQGKITSINGTGNNIWDLAIVAHNLGSSIMTTWCSTDNPDFASPCSEQSYKPYPKEKPNLVFKVNKNQVIPNYFPNKRTGSSTSIGYVEDVVKYIKSMSCVTI